MKISLAVMLGFSSLIFGACGGDSGAPISGTGGIAGTTSGRGGGSAGTTGSAGATGAGGAAGTSSPAGQAGSGPAGAGGRGNDGGATGAAGATAGGGGRGGNSTGAAGAGGGARGGAGGGGGTATGGSGGSGTAGNGGGGRGGGNQGGASGGGGRGGASGAGGRGGASGSTGTAGAGGCQHGQYKGNDVLIIGDSFFALSHDITRDLVAHARAAGAIGANETYRDASVSGTRLSPRQIPGQYSTAQQQAPVKILIMDGIGNDLLASSGCSTPYSSCSTITAALDSAKTLMKTIASDGTVQHIVYLWYPEAQGNAKLLDQENYVRPLLQMTCEQSTVPCLWVDLRPAFAGHYAEYIMGDGIHPTAAGSQASADALWAAMQAQCIAQ